jgi:hypothetical protein
MKKLTFLLLMSVLICNCNKDNNNQDNSDKVRIKGTISAKGAKKQYGSKGDEVLTIANAKKVMIFRGSEYTIAEIVDSSFTVSADAGTANAIAFLDSKNKFIGLLCTEGLNLLPLVGLTDGNNTIIDLQTLTMPGDSIIPMHNPFGDEINISPKELESLRSVGSYYESLAKNIDADNDGELDILVKKHVSLIFHFGLYVGKLGLDNNPPTAVNPQSVLINYGVVITQH